MGTDGKILTGFAGGIGLSLINIFVSFLQLRLFLHYLPSNIVGIWLIFITMGSYVLFLDLGLSPTLGREISFTLGSLELSDVEKSCRVGMLIRSCTRVVSGLAIIVSMVGILPGWAYIRTITPIALRSEIHLAWLVFVVGASVNLIGEGWFAGIYGMGQIFTEKLIRSLGQLFGLTLMALSMILGLGVRGLAIAFLLQAVATILGSRIIVWRLTPKAQPKGGGDFALIKRMIVPSIKYAATLLGGILILQTDNLVIASTLGTSLVPNYQAVSKLVSTLMSLSMMLVVTSTPFISRAHAQADLAEIRRLLERNQRFSLSVIVALGSFIACFADRIIALWLGPNHFVGFDVVWTLLAIMLLEAHHLAMATATMATGKIAFVWPALLAGVLNVIFSIVLARRLGVFGVALGTLFAQVLTNNWYVPFYSMRQLGIPFKRHMQIVIFPVLLFLMTMIGVAAGVRFVTRGLPNLSSILLGCLVVAVVSASLFVRGILSLAERQAISSRVRSFMLSQTAAR